MQHQHPSCPNPFQYICITLRDYLKVIYRKVTFNFLDRSFFPYLVTFMFEKINNSEKLTRDKM